MQLLTISHDMIEIEVCQHWGDVINEFFVVYFEEGGLKINFWFYLPK